MALILFRELSYIACSMLNWFFDFSKHLTENTVHRNNENRGLTLLVAMAMKGDSFNHTFVSYNADNNQHTFYNIKYYELQITNYVRSR
jgi:hypothetical protein